jgi:DNA-binding transcriptional MerR regulator
MAKVFRANRKATDDQIIRLNSVGLSLSTIGEMLDCHPTTITQRLNSLGIPPADTRRAFMEDVIRAMTENQQEWLADQLGPHISIKDYIRNLIVKEYIGDNNVN